MEISSIQCNFPGKTWIFELVHLKYLEILMIWSALALRLIINKKTGSVISMEEFKRR